MGPASRDSQRYLTTLAQALRQEPASIPRRLEFAAALRSVGRNADAIEVYRGIAEVYAEEGHLLQAISLCKGILEIDPDHRDALEMLATLAGGKRSGRMAAIAADFENEEIERPRLELFNEDDDPADEFEDSQDTQRTDLPSLLADIEVQGLDRKTAPADESLYGGDEVSDVGTAVESPGGDRRRQATPAPVPEKAAPRLTVVPEPATVVAQRARPTEQRRAESSKLYDDDGPGLYAEDEASIDQAVQTPIPRASTLLKDPPHFPLLSDLPRPAFLDLLARMALIHVDAGVAVVRQGEIGDACYLIASGAVRVVKNGIEVARLSAGSFFGEFAVLADQRRHASVETTEPCELLEIRRVLIDELVHNHPGVARTLRTFYRERLLQTLVATAPFFEKLRPEERNAVADRFRPRRFGRGSLIVEQGSPGGGLYLILVGQVDVVHHKDGQEAVLGTLGEGSYFGEMSLLRGGTAGASVRANRMTEVVQLPPRDFYEVVSQHPVLWEHLRAEAERRAMLNHQIVSGEARSSDAPHIYLV